MTVTTANLAEMAVESGLAEYTTLYVVVGTDWLGGSPVCDGPAFPHHEGFTYV